MKFKMIFLLLPLLLSGCVSVSKTDNLIINGKASLEEYGKNSYRVCNIDEEEIYVKWEFDAGSSINTATNYVSPGECIYISRPQ